MEILTDVRMHTSVLQNETRRVCALRNYIGNNFGTLCYNGVWWSEQLLIMGIKIAARPHYGVSSA